MPKYYIKYDSTACAGREFWFGSDPNYCWVDYQCNALVFDSFEAAKAALAAVVNGNFYPVYNSQYKIVEEKTTFDVVYSGDQTIVSQLRHLANNLHGYTTHYLKEEILKIAKEIKQ